MMARRARSLAVAVLALLAAALAPARSPAQTPPLGATQIRVLGLAVDLDTRPDLDGLQSTMTAVKDVPTGVATFLGSPADFSARSAPPGALVKADLAGPSFGSAVVPIAGPPNQLLELPLLRAAGDHFLTNVRLEDADGNVLLRRDPARDPIVVNVIDQLLVTQVTSRPLSLEEIQQKGIVIDSDNFTVLNFAVALTLGSEKVQIEFPAIIPTTAQGFAEQQESPQLSLFDSDPAQLRRINIPNFSLTGFRMRQPPDQDEKEFSFPPVDGVIIIPGNLAFLHQFFSVIVQATNTAPGGSGLVLRAARASVALPKGDDGIAGSGDDPLRVAETASGGVQTSVPLTDAAGSDAIAPQATNAAEFLIEGLREGTHVVDFDLRGDLFVPSLGRTLALEGVAAGVVQVKNPTFGVVLAHPKVVREGEPYSLFATVTNTSSSPANLFRIELARRSISGARLLPGQDSAHTLDSLAPGESATFEWRLEARTTGEVTGTVFLADPSINGSFVLTAGVGDTGIPLSPDTLILPQTVGALPADFVSAAVRMLGQAYSVATAPAGALPKDVARIGKSYVFDRAVRVAQAGLHVAFGDATSAAVEELLLDWLGNDRARLDTLFPDPLDRSLAEQDLRAFDALRRAAGAGEHFTEVAAQQLAAALAQQPLSRLARDLASRFASRPDFVAFGVSSRGAAVRSELRDAQGARLGGLDPNAAPADEIPFAASLPLRGDASGGDELLLVASPEAAAYTLAFSAQAGAAHVDPSATLRLADGLALVTFAGVDLAAGGAGRLAVTPGGAPPSLEVDADGDGSFETKLAPLVVETIADAPPALIAVQQWAKGALPDATASFDNGDPLGRLVGVLFSEEVTKESAEAVANYAVPANQVLSVALQPDRRLAFFVLSRPVGPFVARALSVFHVDDVRGNRLDGASLPIAADPARGVGGSFSGQVVSASGDPIPFASVQYIQPVLVKSPFEDCPKDLAISTLQADASGRFDIDYVLQDGWAPDFVCTSDIWLNERAAGGTNHFKLEAQDPETGAIGRLSTRVSFDGQQLSLRVVIRGSASLEGHVFDEAGHAIAGGDPGTPASIPVVATNLSTGGQALSWVDATGHYAFPASALRADGTRAEAPSLQVGNVALQVVRPSDGLTGVTTVNLPAAGTRVVQDLVMVPPFRFGTVSGVVLEADGQTPAANVGVQLAGRVLTGFGLDGLSSSEGLIGAALTDASGAFHFENVPAGDVHLLAQRVSTFEQAEARGIVAAGADTALALVLPGGGGTLRGLVVDALGAPVPFALVAGGPTLTHADASGRFEIVGLPLGTFTIQGQGFDSPSLGQLSVTTTGPHDVQDVVIALGPVGSISGSALEADGTTPIPSQKLQLWSGPDGGKGVIAETFSDEQGRYAFRNYPVGPYSVRAIRRADMDGGMALTEIRFAGDLRDADVVFRGLGEISGRVVQDNGTPVIADVVVTRKVWRIITDEGPADNAALGLDVLQQFAQIPELTDFVNHTIAENGLNAPVNEFFMLIDESATLRSDVLGPGGEVTGRFRFNGDATGGPFTVAALGAFLTPAEVAGEIPRTTDPAAREVDVGDIVLEPATGALHGTVLMPDGMTPAGADVAVRLRSLQPSGEVQIAGVGSVPSPVPPEVEVTTDEHGRFELPLVLRGGFVLSADTGVPDPAIAAHTPAEMQSELFADATGRRLLNVRLRGQAIGAVPKLPIGEFATVDVRLADVAGTRVRVVENDGQTPVEGARVQLTTASSLDDDPPAAFSDPNGEVEFFPLPEGGFSVAAVLPGSPQRGSAAGVVPVDPPNGLEIPITLRLGAVTNAAGQVVDAAIFGSVAGTVFRADGTPSANPAEVRVRASGGVEILASSGSDGRYLAENVPGGFFRVDVFEPFTARRGSASGTLTADGQTVETPVTLVGLGQVTGSVFSSDGSHALAGIDVALLPSGSFSDRLVTRSDASGVYALPGVPLGSYTVTVHDAQTGLAGAAQGTLARDGDVASTDVFLEASGGISGVVYGPGVLLDAQGQPIHPDGTPFLGAPVAAGVEVRVEGNGIDESVQTDAQGAFATPAFLPVGDYALTARTLLGDDGATGTAHIRFDGDVAAAALALRGTGRVEGVVLDSLGAAPVEGASVTLASTSPFGGPAHSRITGADGRFAFDGVAVGAFSLTVHTNLQTPQLGGAADAEIASHRQVVAFADDDADAAHQAIRLQQAGSVALRVVLADGSTPAEGAVATLDGAGHRLSHVADASAALRFEGIPLGSYTLSIREPVSRGVASRALTIASNGQSIELGTVALDAAAPVVVATLPGAGASGVDPSAAIEVRFSEPVDPASITAETFAVRVAGVPVAGQLALAENGALARFTPAAPLPDLQNVSVALAADVLGFEGQVLAPGVHDLAGLSLGADFRFAFSTRDSTPPRLVSVSPADGSGEVDLTAVVRFEFSEPIDAASIQSFALRDGAGRAVAGQLNAQPILGGRVVVFTPAASLSPNQSYTATLTGPVADRSGNEMADAALVSRFASIDTQAPALASLALAPGARLVAGRSVLAQAALAGAEPGARVEFYLNGALLGTDTEAPFEQALLLDPALGAGATLSAVAVDAAGNRSPARVVALAIAPNQPPVVSLLAPASGSVSQGATVAVQVSASDDVGLAELRFAVNDGAVAAGAQPAGAAESATASFSFRVPSDAPVGSTLRVRAAASDALGVSASSAQTAALTVGDQLAPSITIGSPPAGTLVEPGATLSVFVRGDDASGVAELGLAAPAFGFDQVRSIAPAASPAAATFQIPIPAGAAPGALTLTARARDAAGNAASRLLALRIADRLPPSVSLASLSGSLLVEAGHDAQLRATASDETGVVRIELAAPGAATQVRSFGSTPAAVQDFAVPVPASLAPGAQLAIVATAFDAAGNASPPASLALTVADLSPPSIALLEPASGTRVAPGAHVALRVAASDPGGVRRIAFGASGAASGAGEQRFAPPLAQAEADFAIDVPAGAAAGAQIALDASAEDASGNAATASVSLTVADTIPPSVISVDPPDGATGVAPGALVSIRFSEPLAAASVTPQSIGLEAAGSPVAAALALSGDGRTATLTPAAPLAAATGHRVFVTTAVADLAGNALAAPFESRFTTAGADLQGPRLLELLPADGETGASVRPLLRACFDDALAATSAASAALRVLDPAAGSAELPVDRRLESGDRCLVAELRDALGFEKSYQVELSGALRGADGNPVTDPSGAPFASIVHGFTTGSFAIVAPRRGESVVERSSLVLEARGSAGLGIASVVFEINGTVLAPLAGPIFQASFAVPAAADVPSLAITARARDANGGEIATDGLTVQVVPGLRFERALTGVPLGGSAALRLVASSPPPASLVVSLVAFDPTIAAVPASVVFPAGASALDILVTGLATGGTAVTATSAQGVASTIASVSEALAPTIFTEAPPPDATPPMVASPVGAAIRPFASAGQIVLPPAVTRSVRLRLLHAPAAQTTPVTIESSNAAVATAGAVSIQAGSTDAVLVITSGAEGEAVLVLHAGSTGLELHVVVGAVGLDETPATLAPPIGMVVLPLPSLGDVFLAPSGSRALSLRLLDAPAAQDLLFTASSTDPAVAQIVGTVRVPAGSTDAALVVQTGAAGQATLSLRAGEQGRELRVSVGAPNAGATPPVLAPPVGAVVLPLPSLGEVIVPAAATSPIRLRMLDVPASQNTPVSVTSSDPTVAGVLAPAAIAAGATDVTLAISAGAPGDARLTLTAGSVARELHVVVGTPSAGQTPPIVAPPIGLVVLEAGNAGMLFLDPGDTKTVSIPLLSFGSLADLPVTAASLDASIATVTPGSQLLATGQRSISLTVHAVAAGAAETRIDLRFGVELRTLRVVVGVPRAAVQPPTVAPPVGIQVQPPRP